MCKPLRKRDNEIKGGESIDSTWMTSKKRKIDEIVKTGETEEINKRNGSFMKKSPNVIQQN